MTIFIPPPDTIVNTSENKTKNIFHTDKKLISLTINSTFLSKIPSKSMEKRKDEKNRIQNIFEYNIGNKFTV